MGVVIVDNEYESCARMFQDIFSEVLELGQDFSKELTYLTENGFRDALINNAIIEKSNKVYTAMQKLQEASEGISDYIKDFIEEADETDSYLY